MSEGEGGEGLFLRVDKVDADELVAHEDLAFLELWHGQVGLPFEDVDAAGFLDEDAGHGLGDGCHGEVMGGWCCGVVKVEYTSCGAGVGRLVG